MADWRTQVPQSRRDQIIHRIADTRQKYLKISDDSQEVSADVAYYFEKDCYTNAVSEDDYYKKICEELFTMEATSKSTVTWPGTCKFSFPRQRENVNFTEKIVSAKKQKSGQETKPVVPVEPSSSGDSLSEVDSKAQKVVSKTLFVRNVSYVVNFEDVKFFFSGAGEVVDVRFAMDSELDKFKGYGYVEFATPEAAQKALQLNNKFLCGEMHNSSRVRLELVHGLGGRRSQGEKV